MKKFMDWLANKFAPKMNEICSRPWIAAVSSSMQKVIPFILTGSLIYFYNVFRSYIPALPNLGPIADYSFGLISLIISFMVAQQVMEKLNKPFYTTNCGLVAIAVFLMFIMPETNEAGNMVILGGRMGATGIAVGMFAGLFTSIIFNLYSKLHVLENSTSIPDFVSGWINYIVPTVIALGISMVLTMNLKVDIFEFVVWVFSPLASFGQTLPGFVLLCFIPAVLYSMGISSWLFGAVTTPI
ncbi:MAG: PTS sugar transporter subunit IIC, partial [Longicatena sp.]